MRSLPAVMSGGYQRMRIPPSMRRQAASQEKRPLLVSMEERSEEEIVEKKWGKTFVQRRDPTSKPMMYFIILILISIPILSMYVGYTLTINYATPKNRYIREAVANDLSKLNFSSRFTHYLTADFQGGLGNLMFQYAAVYGLAKANGFIPIIPKHVYINKVFPVLFTELTEDYMANERYTNYIESYPNAFDPRSFSLNFEKDVILVGFFQSWKYFEHARKDITEQFRFPKEVQTKSQAFLSSAASLRPKVDNSKIVYVGIHIRRGDFLDSYNVEKGFTVATPDYISRAMDHFANLYDNVVFIATSDDKSWMKEYIQSTEEMPVKFSSHESDILDLSILAMCNHTIITVGSFSWWAGYLAGGDVVYYGAFPEKGSVLARSFMAEEYYYPGWMSL